MCRDLPGRTYSGDTFVEDSESQLRDLKGGDTKRVQGNKNTNKKITPNKEIKMKKPGVSVSKLI